MHFASKYFPRINQLTKSKLVTSRKQFYSIPQGIQTSELNLIISQSSSSQNSSEDDRVYWSINDKTSISFTLNDKPGILQNALNVFTKHNINLSRIQSRPEKQIKDKLIMKFFVDFNGRSEDLQVEKAIFELKQIAQDVTQIGTPEVPWFPTNINDFDHIGKRILGSGDGIQETFHPGFKDQQYRERRQQITMASKSYKLSDQQIPAIQYTQQEKDVWKFCYPKLQKLFIDNACKEYNQTIDQFQKNIGLNENDIPQLNDVSNYVKSQTGWRLKPVGGLLTQREFLNGLAFKIFHSTQYIRHYSSPLYTPEPDIIHELLGHAPMFAHQDFADFSQEIGLASLGANERYLTALAAIYWFTLEFGMCRENGKLKAYGAGILSSVGELEYCVSDKPKYYQLDPFEIAQNHINYPISSMQPYYFVAESFAKAKQQIIDYCEQINKPFSVSYDNSTDNIIVDRKIKTRKELTGNF